MRFLQVPSRCTGFPLSARDAADDCRSACLSFDWVPFLSGGVSLLEKMWDSQTSS